tara:strand:- start:345 stop:461 length:117 start_codon:yes stop_codon:yes gene_type:complete
MCEINVSQDLIIEIKKRPPPVKEGASTTTTYKEVEFRQ